MLRNTRTLSWRYDHRQSYSLQTDSITVSSRQVDTIESTHRYSLSVTLFRAIGCVLGSFTKCIHIDYKSTAAKILTLSTAQVTQIFHEAIARVLLYTALQRVCIFTPDVDGLVRFGDELFAVAIACVPICKKICLL